jgi:Ca-activated chloride channel homolog
MKPTPTMRAFGCGCFLMVAAAQAAQAQIFRSSVDIVGLTVTVTDARGQEITGLTAEDFAVYEDGVPQQVSLFGGEKVPLDVALVLDTSSSMHAVQPAVKRGARALLSKLRQGDRALVVDVKQRIQIRAGLDADLSHVVASINDLSSSGSTALFDGLYMSLREFARERRQRPEVRRQALVVFSDGLDTASHVRFEDVSELARALDVTIYTITMHDGQLPQVVSRNTEVRRAMWEMRALTVDSGGRAFFPSKPPELEGVYDAIARELVNQYTLAYAAPAASRQQALRRISIRLLPPAQGVPRTRTSYLANHGQAGRSLRRHDE